MSFFFARIVFGIDFFFDIKVDRKLEVVLEGWFLLF